MPSSATITAFYTFTQNTRAKASQVNANFQNFRGHLIPINTDTISSSDVTHDLGSTEHNWRNTYTNLISFVGMTTTSRSQISNDTSYTNGALAFKINGTEVARIDDTGFLHAGLKLRPVSTTGANTVGPAGCVMSSKFSSGLTGGGFLVAGSTITVTSVGRPVLIGIQGIASGSAVTTGAGSCLFMQLNDTAWLNDASPAICSAEWILYRNTVTSIVAQWSMNGGAMYWSAGTGVYGYTTTAYIALGAVATSQGPGILAIDMDLTNGTNTYFIGCTKTTGAAVHSQLSASGRLYGFTLY